MKVNILLTKKVPGAQRVDWPEIPEWAWDHLYRRGWGQVIVWLDADIEIRGVRADYKPGSVGTWRIYDTYTRKLIAESTADGPWIIKEPDQEVPLTVVEVIEKFSTNEWVLLAVRGLRVWETGISVLYLDYKNWTEPTKIVALNSKTLECVKVAEVVE